MTQIFACGQTQNMEQSYSLAQKIAQIRCQKYNDMPGDLGGINCEICKNKGFIAVMDEEDEILRECTCMDKRRAMKRMQQSGLGELLERYTFESYQSKEGWQKEIFNRAKQYITDYAGKWFFIGGQVGCGKSHICTAIVKEFLEAGMDARYMLWRDDVVKLKALVNDEEAYKQKIEPLKRCKVLYIDDLFKVKAGERPTAADINIAFELLNSRYNNTKLVTVLSSEHSVDRMIDFDEGVGSRIYERTKDYCLVINPDKSKNYRLRR